MDGGIVYRMPRRVGPETSGTGVVVGLAGDVGLTRHLILEAGVRYFGDTPQSPFHIAGLTVVGDPPEPEDVGIVLPEVSVQFQLPLAP